MDRDRSGRFFELTDVEIRVLEEEVEGDFTYLRRDGESQLHHVRRMELILRRVTRLRELSLEQLARDRERFLGRGQGIREVCPSPPRPVFSPHSFPSPFSSPEQIPSTLGSPLGGHAFCGESIGIRAAPPVRLGVVYRALRRSPRTRFEMSSWSPIYRDRELSARGYTWIEPDTEDLGGESSVQGAEESEVEGGADGEIEIIESQSEGQRGGDQGSSQASLELELEMWTPGTPVEEVVMLESSTVERDDEDPSEATPTASTRETGDRMGDLGGYVTTQV